MDLQEWTELHRPQLSAREVPEKLWSVCVTFVLCAMNCDFHLLLICVCGARPRIHKLLSEEQMPGEGVQLAMVEADEDSAEPGLEHQTTDLVVVSTRQLEPDAAEDVWVVDHAWTYESLQGAEQVLKQVQYSAICDDV